MTSESQIMQRLRHPQGLVGVPEGLLGQRRNDQAMRMKIRVAGRFVVEQRLEVLLHGGQFVPVVVNVGL